jgi:predicted porin
MQKKLIALAVAGLASVPAFAADSAVTLYGLIDLGYSYRSDNYNSAVSSRSGFDSGQFNGTRLGVRGFEELSPGLKAIFTLEAGIAADTGGSNQGSRAWGRQTFAGLDWAGTKITLGHQYTPAFNMYATYEPFALGSVAETNNIFTHILARADNSIAISTPFWGDKLGFAVEGMYSLHTPANDSLNTIQTSYSETGQNGKDLRYASIFPKLKFGPATLLVGYSEWKVKEGEKSNNAFDAGLNLDFKAVQLFGAFARYKNAASDLTGTAMYAPNGEEWKFDRWFLGGNIPLGNFNLLASYAYSKDKNDQDLKAQQWGIGGLYNVSKRTSFYVAYAKIITSDNTDALYSGMSTYPVAQQTNLSAYTPSVADATNGGGGYRSGLNLGLRHTF